MIDTARFNAAGGIRVLLVDDQQIIAETIRRMLISERDIDFHYCPDPTLAIRMANDVSPTVILQDLNMPEMDGLRLVKYFRANPGTREVPLVVLSSKEDARIKAEAFALGANDYLVKVPERLELVARIRHHSKGFISLLERNAAYRELAKREAFIRKTFGRYLSEEVVERILAMPDELKLQSEKRRVTILMSDLRGFTAISERLPAEHVVDIINFYLGEMTEIIHTRKGTIDEFIGDAILVIFGAPEIRADDARRALACAVEMQLAMGRVNQRNRELGYPEIAQGIGINTGDLVVGNIGCHKRFKYGVVGQNVNLTARIESYTVGGQILISESTREACGEILRIDDQFEVTPKGFKEPITIYEVGGIGGQFNLFLPEKRVQSLPDLKTAVPIRFMIIQGKRVCEERHDGRIIRYEDQMADMRTETPMERMTNLRFEIADPSAQAPDAEIYAKVIQTFPQDPLVCRIRFTAASSEAEAWFRKMGE